MAESGATLLRTLTEKSTLKFGKHHDIPVWKLLEKFSDRKYLIWVYYHCSNINFNADVLKKLCIDGEDRIIKKPGKDIVIYEQVMKSIDKYMFAVMGYKKVGIKKRCARGYLKTRAGINKRTKGQMARKNQGH